MAMKRLSRKTRRTVLIVLAAAAALAAAFFFMSGSSDIVKLNHYSVMDWKLGERIDGIASVSDAERGIDGYEFFSDDKGSGLKAVNAETRYYLGEYGGKFCVTGFSSNESNCSVMSIRVGDDELKSKTLLLDKGFRMKEGGYNACRAASGEVYVELGFSRGIVIEVSAYLT